VGFELAQAAHAVLNLGDNLRFPVKLLNAKGLAQLIDEGQERDRLAERDTPAFEPRDVLPSLLQCAAQLQQQARFADPGFACDQRYLTAPSFDVVEESK
jgi:hypothetical protein